MSYIDGHFFDGWDNSKKFDKIIDGQAIQSRKYIFCLKNLYWSVKDFKNTRNLFRINE